MSETQLQGRQFATFYVDGHFFGIDVQDVQEIIRRQHVTSVPLAPEVIHGLINLRGQIVTALDMRTRLGLALRRRDEETVNVVVHTDDGAVSLLVDEIGDVVEVNEADLEQPPENVDAHTRDLLQGVCKSSDRLLLVLHTGRTLGTAERND